MFAAQSAPAPAFAPQPAPTIIYNIISPTATATASAGAAPVVVMMSSGPGMFVRILYFLLLGWWLGAVVSVLAWTLNVTIIGLPLGLYMINRLPAIITLRPSKQGVQVIGGTVVVQSQQQQQSFLVRAGYFLLIGWWLSGLWLTLAYACLLTLILIPIAFWMYGRVAAVTTLQRT